MKGAIPTLRMARLLPSRGRGGIYVGGEPLQVPETGTMRTQIRDRLGWDGLLVYVELNFPRR